MIARQNSTPIQSQCDAVVASIGGEIVTSCHISIQFAAYEGSRRLQSLEEACARLLSLLDSWGRLEISRSLLEELETYSRNVEHVLKCMYLGTCRAAFIYS